MVHESAVGDFAVGVDVVAGRPDVRPIDVPVGDDRLDDESSIEGALVAVYDVRGLCVVKILQNVAPEDMDA